MGFINQEPMDIKVQKAHLGLNKCEKLIPGFYCWNMHQLEATAPHSHASSSEDIRQGFKYFLYF